MKNLINYYGGKTKMLPHIVPLIPKHSVYTESFAGGLSVFFAKEPVKTEIINDINAFIPNFYEVLLNDFDNLKRKIDATLYSRASYYVANSIYKAPHLFSKLQQAWAFFMLTNAGFSGRIGSFGCYTEGTKAQWFEKQKDKLNTKYQERLRRVQIECTNALDIIRLRDSNDTFHYIDPPYFNSDMGHYDSYSEKDFTELLELLGTLKGKFLLSSYPSEILSDYIKANGWFTKSIHKTVSASNIKNTKQREKIEVLTANYPI